MNMICKNFPSTSEAKNVHEKDYYCNTLCLPNTKIKNKAQKNYFKINSCKEESENLKPCSASFNSSSFLNWSSDIVLKSRQILKRKKLEKYKRKKVLNKLRKMVGGEENCTQLEIIKHVINRIQELEEKLNLTYNQHNSSPPLSSNSLSSVSSFSSLNELYNSNESLDNKQIYNFDHSVAIHQLIIKLTTVLSQINKNSL